MIVGRSLPTLDVGTQRNGATPTPRRGSFFFFYVLLDVETQVSIPYPTPAPSPSAAISSCPFRCPLFRLGRSRKGETVLTRKKTGYLMSDFIQKVLKANHPENENDPRLFKFNETQSNHRRTPARPITAAQHPIRRRMAN